MTIHMGKVGVRIIWQIINMVQRIAPYAYKLAVSIRLYGSLLDCLFNLDLFVHALLRVDDSILKTRLDELA